jgi:hypothetical protein
MMDWNRGPGPIVAFIGVFFILILLKTLSQRDTGETFLGGYLWKMFFKRIKTKNYTLHCRLDPVAIFVGFVRLSSGLDGLFDAVAIFGLKGEKYLLVSLAPTALRPATATAFLVFRRGQGKGAAGESRDEE